MSEFSDTPTGKIDDSDERSDATGFRSEGIASEALDTTASQKPEPAIRKSPPLAPPIDFDPPRTEGALGRIDSYEILAYVGRGGMGVVWKAIDERLRRPVAIKLMAAELSASESARKRFFREARAAAAVNHPNIVTIYAVAEFRGTPYLAMEFVEGQTLRERIASGRPFFLEEILRIGLQVAGGLAAAHRHGIVHRDIKPSNVMLESGVDRVKIADFGLARVALDHSDLSSLGDVLGTPSYMSPEQVEGRDLDARSDLFNVGILLYEMTCGRAPFRAANPLVAAQRVVSHPHVPLASAAENVPKYLADIVDRLLSKSPDDRFQSAEELETALAERLGEIQRNASSSILALKPATAPAPERRYRIPPRYFALTGAFALAAFAIAGGVAYSTGTFGRDDERTTPRREIATEAVRSVIRVAQDGSGDFASIEEAVAAAATGDEVRVGEGVYRLNLDWQAAGGADGVALVADEGASLLPADPALPILSLSGVDDAAVEGFRLESTGTTHAIHLERCSGIRLERLHIRQTATPDQAAILVTECNLQPESAPLRIVDCRIETSTSGQCVWIQSSAGPMHDIRIERNEFLGAGAGTLVVFASPAQRVAIGDNVFYQGFVGLNLDLRAGDDAQLASERFSLARNTFASCRSWLGLMATEPAATPFAATDNLILGGGSIEGTGEQQSAAAAACIMRGNVWERQETLEPHETDALREWARFEADVPIVSRDPNDDDFLRPAAGSTPLAGEEGAGAVAGARAPSRSP